MRWPATFGAERIDLIERLARQTGHHEQDLCRALRGVPMHQAVSFELAAKRAELDQLVQEVLAR